MRTVLPFVLLVVFAVTTKATQMSWSPTPANLYDLDHHSAYTWRINNINLGGATITGASLTFSNIANWDTNPNILFIHLLNTAINSGVASFTDATGAPVQGSQIHDNFAAPWLASNPLVASGTGNTFLASPSFTMTPTTYTYYFTAAQLVILQGYIASGNNLAFGIDPDCHFFNNGITFTISVPETGSTVALLGLAAGSLAIARRKFCL